MPLPSSGSGSGTSPISGLVPPTTSGGSSSNGYLSQTGVDLNIVGNTTETLVLTNHTQAYFQMTQESGVDPIVTPFAFSLSLQGSIDGVYWQDTGKTLTAPGITGTYQDITAFKLLRVIVTTANGAALIARISIVAKTV